MKLNHIFRVKSNTSVTPDDTLSSYELNNQVYARNYGQFSLHKALKGQFTQTCKFTIKDERDFFLQQRIKEDFVAEIVVICGDLIK